MHWLLFSGISVLCFTSFNLVSRVVALEARNERARGAFWGIACGIILLPILLWNGLGSLTWSTTVMAAAAGSIFLYGIFNRFHFTMRRDIDISDVAILNQLAPLASLVTLRIIADELLSPEKLFAALCILGGTALIFWGGKRKRNWKALLLGSFVFMCLGIAYALDKIATQTISLPLYMLLIYFIPGVVNGLTPPLKSREIFNENKRSVFLILLLAALTIGGGLAALQALQLTEGGKVVLVNSSTTMVSVVLGILLFREFDHLWRKLFAMVFVTIGIIILATT